MHAAANDRPPPKWAQNSGKAYDMACLQQKVEDLEKTRCSDGASQQVHQIGPKCNIAYSEWSSGRVLDLTYRGLSGEQGGIVSWNAANCSRDVLWTID
jgi:hypothetical protein